MRCRHQEALTKSVMLGHASQTSDVMQNVHDKPGNLPDPDIFAFDSSCVFLRRFVVLRGFLFLGNYTNFVRN